MPLTVRTNGSSGVNIITASWFNDFLNLLTGAMQDQEVTIKNVLILQAIGAAPSTAASGAVVTGTGLGIGAYVYVYTYANADGETTISPTLSVTTTTGNQKVNLSAITVGPTGTTKRNLYRTAVGGGTNYKFLAALNDNTTTTYTDTTADASLGAAAPTVPSFGGALIIKDSTGAVKFKINNDGSFSAGGSTGFGNTTINGTLTVTGTSSLDNGNITTNGSGQITLPNNTSYAAKSTPGAIARGLLYMDTTNRTVVRAGDGNRIMFFDLNGNTIGWVDTGGAGFTAGQTKLNHGGITGLTFFSGTGSVTVAHGYGATPTLIVPVQNVSGSQTMGYSALGSTNVTITTGAGLAWEAAATG